MRKKIVKLAKTKNVKNLQKALIDSEEKIDKMQVSIDNYKSKEIYQMQQEQINKLKLEIVELKQLIVNNFGSCCVVCELIKEIENDHRFIQIGKYSICKPCMNLSEEIHYSMLDSGKLKIVNVRETKEHNLNIITSSLYKINQMIDLDGFETKRTIKQLESIRKTINKLDI